MSSNSKRPSIKLNIYIDHQSFDREQTVNLNFRKHLLFFGQVRSQIEQKISILNYYQALSLELDMPNIIGN
ncbi:hypothetical protein BpHYR1_049290 [Brachionus plicatilis]|uniref:Uncharacterized protein n=1 Tax=Brachionus plicatilis TaxID=10195 RepID=A0A3M7P5E4_BRAPC|nr:hypothetical protein BpHYR1_049290 [Brachionus plicatilis]